jgi:hypothetical protein
VSGPKWSHRSKDQRQIKNETKNPAKLQRAAHSGVLRIDPGLAVAPTSQLLQPLPTTNPEHPTHWALGSRAPVQETSIDWLSVLGATG